MTNRAFLSGVGIAALAGALSAAPAHASGGEVSFEAEDEAEVLDASDYRLPISTARARTSTATAAPLFGPTAPIDSFAGFQIQHLKTIGGQDRYCRLSGNSMKSLLSLK